MTSLIDRFASLEDEERRRVSGLVLCIALFLLHCVWFSTWYIEDAAISFAYARNLVDGEGFVTNPGMEWVEGFSNPTWTLLLAVLYAIGISPWIAAKLIGAAMGAATLPLAYSWARRTNPGEAGLWPLLAPLALATSLQHVLWAVGGLENALFSLLLAAAVLRILDEGESPSLGISGVLLGLLAITRPEAPMYAGVIALLGGGFALRAGRLRWFLSFAVAGLLPFLSWHIWRYGVFAWEFPNTYYAKLGEERFKPWAWNKRGWNYVRNWALYSTYGFLLPVFAFGQTGFRGRRAVAGTFLTGLVLGLCIPGLGWLRLISPIDLPEEPAWAVQLRVIALVVYAMTLPLLGLGRPGAKARIMAWCLAGCALVFALYTGGDWMQGFRWLSMAAVPLSVLLADAAHRTALALSPALGHLNRRLDRAGALKVLLVLPILIGGVAQTVDFLFGIETTPYDVRRRVLYMQGVQKRLHLDRVSLLEVDMGAHMWWSGFELIDLAGLCDVRMARHRWQPVFLDEYLHEERVPTFIHIHGGWATKTGVPRRPWFNREYLEIPGYSHNNTTFHIGSHIRKDLVAAETWTGDASRRRVFDPVTLEGLETPAPLVHPGGRLFVELGWSIRKRPPGFRPLLFLHREGEIVVRDFPPAYDWLPIPRWRAADVMIGRYSVSLPQGMSEGIWDLGIVLVDDGGKVTDYAADPAEAAPVFMAGEARWNDAIEVRDRSTVTEAATVRFGEAVLAARAGSCDEAEILWRAASSHLLREDPWQDRSRPAMETELSTCWARRAEQDEDPESIHKARKWDHHAPETVRVSRELADVWTAWGDLKAAEGDDEEAWRGWSAALVADPGRTWVRRRAEAVRD